MRDCPIALALCAMVLFAQSAEIKASSSAATVPTSCSQIDIRMNFSIKKPALLLVENDDGDWELAAPTNTTKSSSYMDLSDKTFKLACPGTGNTLTQTGEAVSEATCTDTSGEAVFVIDGETYAVLDITCTSRITPYEQATGNTCKGDGTEFTIGFIVEEEMFGLITTCHRVDDGKTYYSSHVLNGAHFPDKGNGGSRKESRPSFAYYNSILFNGFSPSTAYNQNNELTCLKEAMGSTAATAVFNAKKNKYFTRGHLCPNADFIQDTWRDTTFTYINAQPQWQVINGGNWNNVEIYVRYHAAAIKKPLNVVTGVIGTLSPNDTGVYLASNDRMPVPNNYVKLVQDPSTNKCIGFVANNFAYSYSTSASCSITCSDYSWPSFTDAESDGDVSCCTADEIQASYSDAIPDTVPDCSGGVLEYAA